jgi:hypothetical protein
MGTDERHGIGSVGDPEDPFIHVPLDCQRLLMEAFDHLPPEAEDAFTKGSVSTALAFLRGAGHQLLAFQISVSMPHRYDT